MAGAMRIVIITLTLVVGAVMGIDWNYDDSMAASLSDNKTVIKCSDRPADIVFLLDSSSSEGADGFMEQINFVYNITSSFDIAPDKVQVSVVTYATRPHNEFFLNDHLNKTDLLAVIKKIMYLPGSTQTDDGLSYVLHNSFRPEHGARNDSDKVLIVLTDGKSTRPAQTADIANQIHSTDITVISIGIGGGTDRKELAAIASDMQHLYNVANFSILSEIVLDVITTTCRTEGLICSSVPADILFLVDTSVTEGLSSFRTQLEFVKNFTKGFHLGVDKVQFALATLSNGTGVEFWFNEHLTDKDLTAAIDRVGYQARSGAVDIGDALAFARVTAFMHQFGARDFSKHVVILMTDGQSKDKKLSASEAHLLHLAGIQVVSIGIGVDIDQNELTGIATSGRNFFAVANFEVLHSIMLPIQKQSCEVCSTRPADVVFLLDSSNSEGIDGFTNQLDFVKNFTELLIIGPNNIQLSVVTFSFDAVSEFPLNQYSDKTKLRNAIGSITYRPGDTQTDDGLHYINENSFKPANGGRASAKRVVIVVTDGKSTEPGTTAAEARAMHTKGITVISVGVGPSIDKKELENIATDKDTMFNVVNFETLEKILNKVIERTCAITDSPCASDSIDLLFLLDSSTSEGSDNFKKQLGFVSRSLDGYIIGPHAVQVGVVTFSSNINNRFFLNDYNSKASVQAAIKRIPYTFGVTNTGDGLEFVRNVALSAKHGARKDSRKVVVVMTDGKSQQKLLTANQGILLRKAGVKVISIGIGQNVNPLELAVIASDDKHIIKVASFDGLKDVEKTLQNRVCSKLVCASTPADIMFVLDSSASIGPNKFHDILSFVTNFVRKFDVGTSAVQFGVITFANDVFPQFDLGRYSDKAGVTSAIGQILYHYGGTYTEKALRYVAETSFNASHGARSEAAKIVIVLTDGQSHSVEQTKTEAEVLHAMGIEVLSVGIGSEINPQELTNIATNTSYVFSVATFDALETIQTELLQATCAAQAIIPHVTTAPGTCTDASPADVLFILDSSNSEGRSGFRKELAFVEQFVSDLPLGPQHFRFGIITFATLARVQIYLNSTATESELRLAILQVLYDGGLTYTNDALRLARTLAFKESHGARPRVPRYILLLTDGDSTDPPATVKEAAVLRAAGVRIIAIGVGAHVDPVKLISVTANSENVLLANSFDDLSTYVKPLQQKMCSELQATDTSPVPHTMTTSFFFPLPGVVGRK